MAIQLLPDFLIPIISRRVFTYKDIQNHQNFNGHVGMEQGAVLPSVTQLGAEACFSSNLNEGIDTFSIFVGSPLN